MSSDRYKEKLDVASEEHYLLGANRFEGVCELCSDNVKYRVHTFNSKNVGYSGEDLLTCIPCAENQWLKRYGPKRPLKKSQSR